MKIITVVLVAFFALNGECRAQEPEWQEISRGAVNVTSAAAPNDDPKTIYIGTDKGILKTEDSGATWRSVLSLRGGARQVNDLVFDTRDKKVIYAPTQAGLYRSVNSGQRWSRIFKGKNSFENECTAVAVLSSGIFLGTKSGLFSSKDNGRTWNKEQGRLGKSRVFNIAYSGIEQGYIYVSSIDGIYRSADKAVSWERVYVARPGESEEEADESEDDRDEEERLSEIRYVAVEPGRQDNVYLATSRGVFKSKNRGDSWELLPEYGLLSRDTRFLLFSGRSELYALNRSGVFAFRNDSWRELSFNLNAGNINSLALDKEGNLYACADKGLFRSSINSREVLAAPDIISEYSRGEPGIKEVQNQAVKYAEVEPEKIVNWRKQAARRAILPKVSMGLERNSGDLWHWEGGSTVKDCDDTLRRGRETLDWDVTLSWDLSELIWNSDQTSIDTRSRLTVQLRDDILDEVNKIYFERIRVKMEMDTLQIEERQKRFDKELRVKELTASLDALTGGYFSSQIQTGKSNV